MSLSNKIGEMGFECICGRRAKFTKGYIDKEDVKEFIRLLKEEMLISMGSMGDYPAEEVSYEIKRIIDKLAGDKLI
jgi:hypothetical protein